MELSFMQNELVLSLCWTLIHSLWQGLLLATVTGAVMICTRKSKSNQRYRLLTLLFFVFVAVTMITFIMEYTGISRANEAARISQAQAYHTFVASGIERADTSMAGISWLQRFKEYFNTHASMIVMIWFVIFIARFIKLAANLVYVNRLKHYKTFSPSEEWMQKLDGLIASLQIRRKIKMLESGIVKVPVVLGVLKPVILLPVGLLAHLPANEIEAILLHELAHIQRRDYLVNLLQNFAETIFFFNPALMWVSSMIREERENCCDDIAISVTNSKSNFINALIAFQEYKYQGSAYTVAFPGRKNQLLNRVKRIVSEKNKTLNAAEKSLLTLGMGVFIMFSFAAAKKINPPLLKALTVKESVQDEPGDGKIIASHISMPANRFSRRPEEPTVASGDAAAYQIEAPQSIDRNFEGLKMVSDTAPKKNSSPMLMSGRMVLDRPIVEDRFASISVKVMPDNNNDVTTEFSEKNGAQYKIHSVDGVVKEMYVNGALINDITPYKELRDDLEKAIANRTAAIQEKWKRNQDEQKRAADEKRANIENRKPAASTKFTMDAKYHVGPKNYQVDAKYEVRTEAVKDREWRKEQADGPKAMRMTVMADMQVKKQDSVQSFHIDYFAPKSAKNDGKDSGATQAKDGYAHYGAVVKYTDLLSDDTKDEEMQPVKDARKPGKPAGTGSDKPGDLRFRKDTNISQKKLFDKDLKVHVNAKLRMVNQNAAAKERIAKMDTALKHISAGNRKLPLQKQENLFKSDRQRQLAKHTDSILRSSRDRQLAMANRKLETMRALRAEDDARLKAAGNTIKDIASDLEKEGIRINLEKCWFALDNDKFIVDGKPMTQQLHEKFLAKYVTSQRGWGYYYGPVQVTGRGVFMDYKNLSK